MFGEVPKPSRFPKGQKVFLCAFAVLLVLCMWGHVLQRNRWLGFTIGAAVLFFALLTLRWRWREVDGAAYRGRQTYLILSFIFLVLGVFELALFLRGGTAFSGYYGFLVLWPALDAAYLYFRVPTVPTNMHTLNLGDATVVANPAENE